MLERKWNLVIGSGIFALLVAVFFFPCIYGFALPGINLPIVLIALYAALFLTLRGEYSLKRGHNAILLLPILALSLEFAFFNNGLLKFLNLVMIVILSSVQILLMTGEDDFSGAQVFSHIAETFFIRPFHKIREFYDDIFRKSGKSVKGIILGIVIALPILVVLLLLLTSGDMVFGQMVAKVLSWEFVLKSITYVALVAISFSLFGSFAVSLKSWKRKPSASVPKTVEYSPATVLVITVLLSVLMLIFSLVQIFYLTGISELPGEFQYSEYARQGFFQLCAAAAIIFAVIALCGTHTRHVTGKMWFALKIVYTILAGSILILLASAFSRMVLYEQIYRFTRLRLYTQAFMILLGAVTLFVIIKIWKTHFPVMKCIFAATVIALIGLGYFNVDGFIAHDAVRQSQITGEAIDYEYLSTLSVDALAEYADTLTYGDVYMEEPKIMDDTDDWAEYYAVQEVRENLDYQLKRLERGDVRTYNLLRERAKRGISEEVRRGLSTPIPQYDEYEYVDYDSEGIF